MSAVTLSYADAEALRVHQLKVRSVNEQIIRSIINDRVSNDLVGKQREAAINKLMQHFQPILAELDAVLTRLVSNVSVGMETFRAGDEQGANNLA